MARGKYKMWQTDEYLNILGAWARNGLTFEQIAHNIGVKRQTLHTWCELYEPIRQAINKNREVVDIAVENALYKRALGYDYMDVVTETIEKDGKETVKTTVRKKVVDPDVSAAVFWLKNRRPAEWQDKRVEVVEVGTGDDVTETITESDGKGEEWQE